MIKNYTDIETSKKLAEILPLESADNVIVSFGSREGTKTVVMPKETLDIIRTPFADIRETTMCWSLAALLDVMPKDECSISFGYYNGTGEYIEKWLCVFEKEGETTNDFICESTGADNPVDACYDMIIHLNELKML